LHTYIQSEIEAINSMHVPVVVTAPVLAATIPVVVWLAVVEAGEVVVPVVVATVAVVDAAVAVGGPVVPAVLCAAVVA
jgi:hypothetical protein